MSIPVKVTDASVRECVLYANLLLRGEDTDQIGTSLTVEISDAFDRWLAERDAALIDGLADEYADSGREQTHGVTSVLLFLHMKAQQRRDEKS